MPKPGSSALIASGLVHLLARNQDEEPTASNYPWCRSAAAIRVRVGDLQAVVIGPSFVVAQRITAPEPMYARQVLMAS